jgi:hypothetical protein
MIRQECASSPRAGELTQNTNAFDTRDASRKYAAAAAQGAHVTTVRDQVAVFAGRGDVLQTAEGRLTTADLVAAERRLTARRGRSRARRHSRRRRAHHRARESRAASAN